MTTEIFLDGTKIEYEDAGGDSTVDELIEVLEKELLCAGRCIKEVWIDGAIVTDWRDQSVALDLLSKRSEVKLKTISVDSLATQGVLILHDYLRFINENIPSCTADLRLGRPSAEKLFAAIFEGLVEVLKTADALIGAGGARRIDLFRGDPAVYFKPLMERLEELSEARSSKDMILMADILEHELVPYIVKMEEAVSGVRCG